MIPVKSQETLEKESQAVSRDPSHSKPEGKQTTYGSPPKLGIIFLIRRRQCEQVLMWSCPLSGQSTNKIYERSLQALLCLSSVAASSPAYVLVWLASLAQIGELSRSLLQDKSSKPEILIYTYWKLTKAAIQRVTEHRTDTANTDWQCENG